MMSSSSEFIIVEDLKALSRVAADLFVEQVGAVLKTRPFFTVALSGGSTPENLYRLLKSDSGINSAIDWEKIHFFWGDERRVPPDHIESNFRKANQALLAGLPLAHENVHRILSENSDAQSAARSYEREIVNFFQLQQGEYPHFDLVWLGMGADGHIASLFPQSAALTEENRLVTANWVAEFQSYRITMTLPVLNHARCIIVLVSGTAKADTLQKVLESNHQTPQFPAQMVRPRNGKLYWIIDRAAASQLHQE